MIVTKAVLMNITFSHLLDAEFTSLPKRQLSLENTKDSTGGWIGTYYKRVIDGKTPSWVGNHQPITFREPVSSSKPKTTLSTLQKSRAMSISFRNQMKGEFNLKLTRITFFTVPTGSSTFEQNNDPLLKHGNLVYRAGRRRLNMYYGLLQPAFHAVSNQSTAARSTFLGNPLQCRTQLPSRPGKPLKVY